MRKIGNPRVRIPTAVVRKIGNPRVRIPDRAEDP
jgi:hypothetical protein